jgi:hypothetical protein
MAYVRARVLQRAGKHAEAVDQFRDVLVAPRFLPVVRLVECLRAAGRSREAEAEARRALIGTPDSWPEASVRALWELWFSVALDDVGYSPPEALELWSELSSGDADPLGSSTAADMIWLLQRLSSGEPLRIQVGGGDFTDSKGRVWGRDRFFTGGCRFGEQHWSPILDDSSPHYPGEIGSTDDDLLYQTERWFPADEIPPTGYRIPLPSGPYRVTLHFAEIYCQEPGLRAFDVSIEGRPELRWYEPPVSSPPTPALEERRVEVRDGALDIEFVPVVQFPKVSAIEVERLEA